MAASTSYSTATADSNINHCYDVFINHRGPDVKKTFASHLYRRLISYGLRVFLDYQELQEGEDLTSQIKGAIGIASVHIAIFSPTYAKSKWCLDELVLMLESGVPIIPVFHHVKPAELRWTHGEGVYARSLHNLQKKRTHDSQPRHDSITIENWRSALSRVADISGLDLEAFNGDEGALLDKLVEVVLKKEKKSLNVARYPTGLDEKVEDFEATVSLYQHSGRVQVIGITGLGGVGKTTLAKELFNRNSSNYSKSYFLFDVRENAKISLVFLQKKLLKGLAQCDRQIDSTDEGIEMIKKHLSVLSSQVFLVLDDVDHVDQVYALLPGTVKDILPTNSLILITSRDKSVLSRSGVQESSIYKLSGLNTERSRELFCSHAFGHPHPLPGFEYLVDKFLRACHGLPLSLKVLGALLYGNEDKSYWGDELESLEQILPNDIQKSLQVSYNALQREEQHIFLDIACFFIGENRDTGIRIWDGSGWKGRRGLQSLLNKSLVELEAKDKDLWVPWAGIEHGYRIRMHDHLRDMGRDLAKDSKLPRRIWNIDDLMQRSFGVTDVRGVRMLRNEYGDDDEEHSSAFSSHEMRKLQLLHIEGVASDLGALHSPNLIWLRWDNCPCSSLPQIQLKKLRVLNVQGQMFETLWQDGLVPLQLQELRINAHFQMIPNSIGQLQHLEQVVLTGGWLEKLPDEFCHLRSLKHLEILESSLRSLPNLFGDLTNLEHIKFLACHGLERLPISFGNLIKLKYLHLGDCSDITLSSESFGNINTLECIKLISCNKIEVLPSQIAHQLNLEKLELDLPKLKEWPSAIGEPSDLGKLVIEAPLLETLPNSLGHDLRNLKYLELQGCSSLKHLPGSVLLLNQLTNCIVEDCSLLELNIQKMVSLEGLWVRRCVNLKCIRCSEPLTQLRELEVSNCSELEELPHFVHLRSLEVLNASGCVKLKSIRYSAQLTQLRELDVSNCSELEKLPDSSSLEVLKASRCVKLKSIWFSPRLTHLRELEVSGCSELEELLGFENLSSLKIFHASCCIKLKRIWCSAQLTQVREFDVSNCLELEKVIDFHHLRSLEVLKASGCLKLNSICCWEAQLKQLLELEVFGCSGLKTLREAEQHLLLGGADEATPMMHAGRGLVQMQQDLRKELM